MDIEAAEVGHDADLSVAGCRAQREIETEADAVQAVEQLLRPFIAFGAQRFEVVDGGLIRTVQMRLGVAEHAVGAVFAALLVVAKLGEGIDGGGELLRVHLLHADAEAAFEDPVGAVGVVARLGKAGDRILVGLDAFVRIGQLGGLACAAVAETVAAILTQGGQTVILRVLRRKLVHVGLSPVEIAVIEGQHAETVDAVRPQGLRAFQRTDGLQELQSAGIILGGHGGPDLLKRDLIDAVRAVLVVAQILEDGNGSLIVARRLGGQGVPVTQIGHQELENAEHGDTEGQNRRQRNGQRASGMGGLVLLVGILFVLLRLRNGPGVRIERVVRVRCRRGGHKGHDHRHGGLGRGRILDRGLDRRRLEILRVHILLQPEAVCAAVGAAQGGRAVRLAAGAGPDALLAVEIVAVADAALLRPLAVEPVVRVVGLHRDRRGKGQIVMGTLLVPGSAVGKDDALDKGLHEADIRRGDLNDLVVAEGPSGQNQDGRQGDHLQRCDLAGLRLYAADAQENLAQAFIREVDHSHLQQALAALGVERQTVAADPDGAVRVEPVLRAGGDGLKALIVWHRNLAHSGLPPQGGRFGYSQSIIPQLVARFNGFCEFSEFARA